MQLRNTNYPLGETLEHLTVIYSEPSSTYFWPLLITKHVVHLTIICKTTFTTQLFNQLNSPSLKHIQVISSQRVYLVGKHPEAYLPKLESVDVTKCDLLDIQSLPSLKHFTVSGKDIDLIHGRTPTLFTRGSSDSDTDIDWDAEDEFASHDEDDAEGEDDSI